MLNNITLVGRFVATPDTLAYTPKGRTVCRFTIANETMKSGTKDKDVNFIDIATYDKTAEFVHKWFKKGDPICIIGRLMTYVVVEKDGRSRKAYEVHASSVDFVPRAKEPNELNEEAPF